MNRVESALETPSAEHLSKLTDAVAYRYARGGIPLEDGCDRMMETGVPTLLRHLKCNSSEDGSVVRSLIKSATASLLKAYAPDT